MRSRIAFDYGEWLVTSTVWFVAFCLLMVVHFWTATRYGAWPAGLAVYSCIVAWNGFGMFCTAVRKLKESQPPG